MAKRKTFNVSDLVDTVNQMLVESKADAQERRQGAMNVLEQVLHITGNYRGFRYLLADEITEGQPGVNYVNGLPHPDPEQRFANTDRTRVMYF